MMNKYIYKMQFEIETTEYERVNIKWKITDKNKVCFNDILILNYYDRQPYIVIEPKVNLYFSEDEFEKYRSFIIDFLDCLRNGNKKFKFYKPCEDFQNLIEFILENIYQYEYTTYSSIELLIKGCNSFTEEGFLMEMEDEKENKKCGCKYVPRDFLLYKEFEDNGIIYSKYPFEYTYYECK